MTANFIQPEWIAVIFLGYFKRYLECQNAARSARIFQELPEDFKKC